MDVKVVYSVAGGPSPEGRFSRYLRMTHSTLIGWRVVSEATALSYHLKLW